MSSASDKPDPSALRDVQQLDELLSQPTEEVVSALARLDGDILILGVGGKMGPTLARMARRACDAAGASRRIIGVSRFADRQQESQLRAWQIETIRADLLDEMQLAKLPEVPNVIFMAGMKFGSTGQEPITWAMNTHLPSLICRRFPAAKSWFFPLATFTE